MGDTTAFLSEVHSFEGGPLRFSRCARRFRSRSRPLRCGPRAPSRASPGAAAARRCRGSCSGNWIRARSTGSPAGCRSAPSSSRRRTARRRPRRWSRRSCARACGSRTTPRAPTSSRASPPPSSTRATRSSASSRSTRRPSPRSPGASSRGPYCSAISSATSSTATASSRPSPPAGATPSRALPETCLVVNGDDPQVGDLARDHPRSRIFGVDDPRHARPALQHAADSKYCLRCGTPYDYAAAYVGHLGDYRCPNCGHARPKLDVVARDDRAARPRRLVVHPTAPEGEARIELPLPGLYNVYNALGAAALALALDAPLDDVVAGLHRFAAAFGRFERITIGDRTLLMLLIKNPAGANEAVRTLVEGARAVGRRDRAERRDRRRPRRLVDLGRRLRAPAGRARPAGRDGQPRGRAGAAVRLRRDAARADRGRAVARARESTAGSS